jgi:hypothetical protein
MRRTMSNGNDQIERYRARAAQCIAVAQTCPDTAGNLSQLEMARAWLLLAERAAKHGQSTLVYETPIPR